LLTASPERNTAFFGFEISHSATTVEFEGLNYIEKFFIKHTHWILFLICGLQLLINNAGEKRFNEMCIKKQILFYAVLGEYGDKEYPIFCIISLGDGVSTQKTIRAFGIFIA